MDGDAHTQGAADSDPPKPMVSHEGKGTLFFPHPDHADEALAVLFGLWLTRWIGLVLGRRSLRSLGWSLGRSLGRAGIALIFVAGWRTHGKQFHRGQHAISILVEGFESCGRVLQLVL